MSGHCPKCGTYHEEDDDRVCGKCNDIDRLTSENADLRARLAGTKMFPLQSSYSKTTPHPTMIPWAVADKAYAVYRGRYGSQQTLERLAERGGFSAGEMDDFYPGWREEVALVTELRARLADANHRAQSQADALVVACRGTPHRSAADLRKALDEQAEAVRKLAEYGGSAHGVGGPFKCWDSRRMIDAFDAVVADPVAWAALLQAAKKDPLAAAVKEVGNA